jgi:hypothetical protein
METEELILKGDNQAFELMWVRVQRKTRDVIVGALHHPPKPVYKTNALLDYI